MIVHSGSNNRIPVAVLVGVVPHGWRGRRRRRGRAGGRGRRAAVPHAGRRRRRRRPAAGAGARLRAQHGRARQPVRSDVL